MFMKEKCKQKNLKEGRGEKRGGEGKEGKRNKING